MKASDSGMLAWPVGILGTHMRRVYMCVSHANVIRFYACIRMVVSLLPLLEQTSVGAIRVVTLEMIASDTTHAFIEINNNILRMCQSSSCVPKTVDTATSLCVRRVGFATSYAVRRQIRIPSKYQFSEEHQQFSAYSYLSRFLTPSPFRPLSLSLSPAPQHTSFYRLSHRSLDNKTLIGIIKK